ncbi:hypothetical protein ACS0TY_000795 [Phlomoides rotata]
MAMRSVLSRGGLFGLMEGNLRSSASSLRYMSDGRILNEEERARETVYIKKMEREKQEKLKKKLEQEKTEKEKAEKAGEDSSKK